MANSNFYTVYIIENTLTQQVYIGCTSKSVQTRFEQHLFTVNSKRKRHLPLYMALLSGGKNFKAKSLDMFESREDAEEFERETIKKYRSMKAVTVLNRNSGGVGAAFVLSPSEQSEIKSLYRSRVKVTALAKRYKVSIGTIYNTLNR